MHAQMTRKNKESQFRRRASIYLGGGTSSRDTQAEQERLGDGEVLEVIRGVYVLCFCFFWFLCCWVKRRRRSGWGCKGREGADEVLNGGEGVNDIT